MSGGDRDSRESRGMESSLEQQPGVDYVIAPRRLAGKIVIAPYSDEWPQRYAALAATIRAALSERVLLLEHAGSTSVPGLAAKPIIDIVLVVADPADEASYVPPLAAAGFALYAREPGWYQHRMLKTADLSVHLHVFGPDCVEVTRMLAMRDHLRRDASDRALYERTKRELATRDWTYLQEYANAKTTVVEDILSRALATRTDGD